MPAYSEKQRRFMGAELARAKMGKKTKTGMSMGDLRDFASLPLRKHERKQGRKMGRRM